MQALIQVLDRLETEAERVLDTLPPTSPDHETVAILLLDLQATRARLADASESTRSMIDSTVDRIGSGRALLDELRGGGRA